MKPPQRGKQARWQDPRRSVGGGGSGGGKWGFGGELGAGTRVSDLCLGAHAVRLVWCLRVENHGLDSGVAA